MRTPRTDLFVFFIFHLFGGRGGSSPKWFAWGQIETVTVRPALSFSNGKDNEKVLSVGGRAAFHPRARRTSENVLSGVFVRTQSERQTSWREGSCLKKNNNKNV